MAIVAECPTCGKRFKAAESQAGRKAKCSGCAMVFVIGGGAVEVVPEAAPAPPVAPQTPTAVAKAPVAAPAPVRPVGSLPPKQTAIGTRSAPPTGKGSPAVPGTAVTSNSPAPARAPSGPVSAAGPTVPAGVAAPVPTRVQVAPARVATTGAPTLPKTGDLAAATRPVGAAARPQTTAHAEDLDAILAPVTGAARQTTAGAQNRTAASAVKPKARKPDIDEPVTTEPDAASGDGRASKGRRWRTLALAVGVLAIAGAAAFFLVPKLRQGGDNPLLVALTRPAVTGGEVSVLASGVGPVTPVSSQVWTITPDRASKALRLPDDFRLVIPAQPPLRYLPRSVRMAPAPFPFAAVASSPSDDAAAAQTISVWNLQTTSRDAQFRLAQHLAFPALSRDGAYYAGQVWEESSRSNRIEIWATTRGQLAHAITIPSASAFQTNAVIGFPAESQIAVLAQDRVQIWELKTRTLLREIEVQARLDDTRTAASASFKLIAVADSRALYVVDLASGKALGPAAIPDSLVTHARRRLALRAMEFSSTAATA